MKNAQISASLELATMLSLSAVFSAAMAATTEAPRSADFGFHLTTGNVFLNTPIGPWAINQKPGKFQLQWSQGITWWPGYAKLWDVRVRGHVRHVARSARTPSGSARIALLPLFSRELRMPWIEVGGDDPMLNGCIAGDCSLREALNAAVVTPAGDGIVLGEGLYNVTRGALVVIGEATIHGGSPLLNTATQT